MKIIKCNDEDLLKLIPKPKTSLLSHTFDILQHSTLKVHININHNFFTNRYFPLTIFE